MDDLFEPELADVGTCLTDTRGELLQAGDLLLEDPEEMHDLLFDSVRSLLYPLLRCQRIEEDGIPFEFGNLKGRA